jgi:phosphatidylserine synthase 2
MFKFFDSTLGEPLPEKNYANDCRVYTPENPDNYFMNLYEATFDVHFVAHLGGWWFKMMIIRDVKVCWICSILFEILEITFRHWLPNFWECWWDHVINLLINLLSYYLTCLDAISLELCLDHTLAITSTCRD